MKVKMAPKQDRPILAFGGFLAGAMAACAAVTFTNPIELIKTRMQLQGELGDHAASRIYRNPGQAFALILRKEGVRGLQQGLTAGYLYQIGFNGCRVGLYEPCRYYITRLVNPDALEEGKPVPQLVAVNVLAGVATGVVGAVLGLPFFLVKTRMQSYSKAASDAVGQQTYYRGAWNGLSTIVKTQGIRGLFIGVDTAIIRTAAGSAAQLPLYNYAKQVISKYQLIAPENKVRTHFAAAFIAGLGVLIVINPWDVILTRLYNQKGDIYKGPIDCFVKAISNEGPMALWKGFGAQFLRVGPHLIMLLMFLEYTLGAVKTMENYTRHKYHQRAQAHVG